MMTGIVVHKAESQSISFFLFLFLKTVSNYIAQTGLELVIFLSQAS